MKQAAGLTLIEAVIAIAILAILMAGLVPGFVSFSQTNTRMELRSGAVAVAQQVMDGLRVTGVPVGVTTRTVDSGVRTYNVNIFVCSEGSANCFTSNDARHIRLEVSFDGVTHYQVETVYTSFD